MARHGMAWYAMAWHDMARYGMMWHGMARCGMARYGTAWHGITWHDMAWHGTTWHGARARPHGTQDPTAPHAINHALCMHHARYGVHPLHTQFLAPCPSVPLQPPSPCVLSCLQVIARYERHGEAPHLPQPHAPQCTPMIPPWPHHAPPCCGCTRSTCA